MNACNFQAPNGKNSLLAAGLEQQFGTERAIAIYRHVISEAFRNQHGWDNPGTKIPLDPNGEPVISWVIPQINELNPQASAVQEAIKAELPAEISESVVVLQNVPDDVLGRDDLFLSLKDVLQEKGINDEVLINWVGINKDRVGDPRAFQSEGQILSTIARVYAGKSNPANYPELRTNELAAESFAKWVKALERYPIAFREVMLTHAIKQLNPQRRSKYVLQLSEVALTEVYGTMMNKPHELNRLGKLYDQAVLSVISDAVNHEPSESGRGYWVHVPRTDSLPDIDDMIESTTIRLEAVKELAETPEKYHEAVERLKELETVPIIFDSQEPTLALEDKFKYGFEEFDYVRVESSKSRWYANPFPEFLGEGYKGYWIHGYNTDRRGNKPPEKVVPITREEAEAIWEKENRRRGKRSRNVSQEIEIQNFESQRDTYNPERVAQQIAEYEARLTKLQEQKSVGVPQNDFKKNVELLRKLSPSTWCTASTSAEDYVATYDNYLLIVNGVTVAGIEAYPVESGNTKRSVKEVTSRANNGIASVDHLDDVLAFMDKHNLDTDIPSIRRAKEHKAAGHNDDLVNVPPHDPFFMLEDDTPDGPRDPRWDVDYNEGIDAAEAAMEAMFERMRTELAQLETVDQTLEIFKGPDGHVYAQEYENLQEPLKNNLLVQEAIAEVNTYIIVSEQFKQLVLNTNGREAYIKMVDNNIRKDPYLIVNLDAELQQKYPDLLEAYQHLIEQARANNVDNDDFVDLPFSKTNDQAIQGYYDPRSDKVVVIASNTPVEQASRVAIHEVAHRGMLRMAKELGGVEQLVAALIAAEQQLMEKLPELLARTGHDSLESLMLDYGFTTDSQEGKIKLLMELAARWAETLVNKPQPSWWKQLLQAIGNWIKQFTGKTLTEQEVNELVGGFVRYGTNSAQASQETTTTTTVTTKSLTQQRKGAFVSMQLIKDQITEMIKQAEADPTKKFVVDIHGGAGIKTKLQDGSRVTNLQLVALFDREYLPANIELSENTQRLMSRLPGKYLNAIMFRDDTIGQVLPYDEKKMKEQLDKLFVPLYDDKGEAIEGAYFSYEHQEDVVGYLVAMLDRELSRRERLMEEEMVKIPMNELRAHLMNNLKEKIGLLKTFVEGTNKSSRYTPEIASKLLPEYQKIFNAMIGDEGIRLGFWDLVTERLANLGYTVRDERAKRDDRKLDQDNPTQQEIAETMGEGVEDWSQVYFEKDPKDTASSRIKRFIATVQDHRIGPEEPPPHVHSFSFSNKESRLAILNGNKTVTVRTEEQAEKMKDLAEVRPGDMISFTLKDEREGADSAKKVTFQAKYATKLTPEYVKRTMEGPDSEAKFNMIRLHEQMLKEEGIDITTTPVLQFTEIKPWASKGDTLIPNRTYFDEPKLADFETLYNDILAVLANQTVKTFDNYVATLERVGRESGNPNLWALANKLRHDSTPSHIKKEFVSVTSLNYNEFSMVLVKLKRTTEGETYYDFKVMNANRGSQLEVIKKNWQESQKFSPILVRNDEKTTVINKKIAEELRTEMNELNAKFTEEGAKNLFTKVLEVNGILMPERALEVFFKSIGKWTKNSQLQSADLQSLFAVTKEEDGTIQPKGIGSALILKLNGITKETEEVSDTVPENKSYALNNPLYTENTAMNILASLYANFSPSLHSFSHRSSEGKTIYDYGFNTNLTNHLRELRDEANLAKFADVDIAKDSFLYKKLVAKDGTIRNNMKMVFMDAIKPEDKPNATGVTRPRMSDREQMLTALGLFFKPGKGRAHYISLTHSDKSTTPIFLNMPKLGAVSSKNQSGISDIAVAEMIQLFNSEFARVRRVFQAEPGTYNDSKYEKGGKFFFFMPEFNYDYMKRLVEAKVITQEDMNAIWKEDRHPAEFDQTRVNQVAKKLVVRRIIRMRDSMVENWKKIGLVTKAVPKGEAPSDRNMFDRLQLNPRILENLTKNYGIRKGEGNLYYRRTLDENRNSVDEVLTEADLAFMQIRLAATDFVVNTFLFNTSMSQLLYGDPAQMWKTSVDATMIEYGKRLAKDIAPGREAEFDSLTYTTVTAEDFTTNETALAEIQELAKDYVEVNDKGEYPINATDAQELVTVKEHLDVMYAYGRIPKKVYDSMLAIVKEANGGFYEFTDPAHRAVIMQPMKPVYVGMRDPANGARLFDYVKSSAYPLYPPFLKDKQLDKVRTQMEQTGIARLNFVSAKKVGAPAKIVNLFDHKGKVRDNVFSSKEWLSEARQRLERKNFKIQQDVPYKADKDSIRTVSQMNKLILESIQEPGMPTRMFDYNGQEVTAEFLKAEKHRIRIELFSINKDKLLEETGIKFVRRDDVEVLEFTDKEKLLKALYKRALDGTQGFTANDVAYLSEANMFENEMIIPLMYAPSSAKFELMLMSLVSDISDIQMPGYSYVQTSPVGMGQYRKFEEMTDEEKKQIIWTEGYEGGNLQTARPGPDGKTLPAQVLVPFNFMVKGKRVNIKDYLIERDGKTMIDPTRVPRELLQMIGARIPNQGHNSMLPLEIVGFVPDNMGDVMIVPAAITKQMGSDFDVDKIYAYRRPYAHQSGRFVPADGRPTQIERLGADPAEYRRLEQRAMAILQERGIKPDAKGRYNPDMFRSALGAAVNEAYPDGNVPKHPVEIQDTKTSKEDRLKSDYFNLHWAILTHPEMLPKILKALDKQDLKEEAAYIEKLGKSEGPQPTFFEALYQLNDFQSQKDAKQLVGLSSLSTTFNSVIQDLDLQPAISVLGKDGFETVVIELTIIDEDGKPRKLNSLSGYGVSTYKKDGEPDTSGVRRTKHDNLTSMQSEFLDYAKNRISDKVHLNLQTYFAAAAFVQLQSKDEPGEAGWAASLKYVTRLMSQPVIKEYAKLMAEGGDSLSGYDGKLTEKVIKKLMGKYSVDNYYGTDEESKPLSYKDLTKALESKSMDDATKITQLKALQFFAKLNEIGATMAKAQSLINHDTNGAGPSMLGLFQKEETRFNMEQLIGTGIGISNISSLFTGIDGEGTEQGYLYDTIHSIANRLVGEFFPYHKLLPVYEQIKEETGRFEVTTDLQKRVFTSLKSFIFSHKSLGLWSDAQATRARLLYNTDDNESLATRVQKAKMSWGKSHYLISRLQPEIDPDGVLADRVSFMASKATQLDDTENTRSWMELLISEDPVKQQLGIDLVRYSFLMGGNQDAVSFVRYIPYSYLLGTQFGLALNKITNSLDTIVSNEAFLDQWFQHYPYYAKQMAKDMPEIGSPENTVERFELPEFNHENFDTSKHPAYSLIVGRGTKKDPFRYPRYLSYYSENEQSWLIYKLRADSFTEYDRMDKLGDKLAPEFDANTVEELRSIIPYNRKDAAVSFGAEEEFDGENPYELPDHGTSTDINNLLRQVSQDETMPEHLRVVGDVFANLGDTAEASAFNAGAEGQPMEARTRPVQLRTFDTHAEMVAATGEKHAQALYDTRERTLFMNREDSATPIKVAEHLCHEIVHARTTSVLTILQDDNDMRAQGYTGEQLKSAIESRERFRQLYPEAVQHVAKLTSVWYEARQALKEEMAAKGYDIDAVEAAVYNSKLRDKTPGYAVYAELVYGMSNVREFATHALTNVAVMRYLNRRQYSGGNGNFLSQIWDLISRIFDAISKVLGEKVAHNSLLQHAVVATMEISAMRKISGNSQQALDNGTPFIRDKDAAASTRKAASPTLTAKEKILGKLYEQKDEILQGITSKQTAQEKAEKSQKLIEIQDQIEQLEKEDNDPIALAVQIADKHLSWAETVLNEGNPSPARLGTALQMIEIWRGLGSLVYGEANSALPATPSPEVASLTVKADNLYTKAMTAYPTLLMGLANGSLNSADFEAAEDKDTEATASRKLMDADKIETYVRAMSIASTSAVVQFQAQVIETVARQRDQANVELGRWVQEFESTARKAAGGMKLTEFYKQFFQTNEKGDAWGLVQRHSQDWYDHRRQLRAQRNDLLKQLIKLNLEPKAAADRRRKIWHSYWDKLSSVAVFADTRKLFDEETGELLDTQEAKDHIAYLEKETDKDNAREMVQQAQERYKAYLAAKNAHSDLVDEQVASGQKTDMEGAQEKTEFIYRHSPNIFFKNFDPTNKKFSDINTDRYVKMAPKRSIQNGKFYDSKYEKLMENAETRKVYNMFRDKLMELRKKLPQSLNDDLSANWLPVAQRTVAESLTSLPNYVSKFSRDLIESLTATDWEIAEDQRTQTRIPIQNVNPDEVPLESRTRDLGKLMLIFGSMANHYEHFSEAKALIELGQNYLEYVNDSRRSGTVQKRLPNGKVVTVKATLDNTIKGMKYLLDYHMYKKARKLQGDTGSKLYSTDFEGKAIHPLEVRKQRKVAKEVEALLEEKVRLSELIASGASLEETMKAHKRIEEIDERLDKVDSRTYFGSKLGDAMIRFNQLKTLSYNPFSAFANVTFGLVSAWIYANGRTDFDKAGLWRAMHATRHSMGKWLSFGTWESKQAYKMLAVMDNLGVIGDYLDSEYGNVKLREKTPGWRKAISPYNWMRSGDYYMKACTTRAMLDHAKVTVTENGEQKEISLWEALDENGNWDTARFGENPDWSVGTEVGRMSKWDQFKNKVIRVNMIIHGNQDKNSPMLWKSDIWGRLFGQFRLSWLPEGFYARFGAEREDLMLGRKTKGRYRTYGDLGWGRSFTTILKQTLGIFVKMDAFKDLKTKKGTAVTAVDIENMRKNLAELAFILGTWLTIWMLRYLADDDEDKRRVTMLIINTGVRLQQDLDFYTNPITFANLTRNTIPSLKVLSDFKKFGDATWKLIFDDDYEMEEWFHKMAKAGLPFPQMTLWPKTEYLLTKDLGDLRER